MEGNSVWSLKLGVLIAYMGTLVTIGLLLAGKQKKHRRLLPRRSQYALVGSGDEHVCLSDQRGFFYGVPGIAYRENIA